MCNNSPRWSFWLNLEQSCFCNEVHLFSFVSLCEGAEADQRKELISEETSATGMVVIIHVEGVKVDSRG